MEKRVQAFFYDYRYYLFPDGISSVSELREGDHVRVRRLAEENCMAPDFIYESIREEELEIEDAARLFPVSVNLYSAEEYDALLRRQVERVCPGCERYGGNSGDLGGHHREITLSGLCYERDGKDDKWNFAQCAAFFWYMISRSLEELSDCIDRGDNEKLNKILNDELENFCFPLTFYGGVLDGSYALCICPDFDHRPVVIELINFLAFVGNASAGPMSEAGWKVFPFRVKGIYHYDGKHKFKGKMFRIVPSDLPSQVTVLCRYPHLGKLKAETCRAVLGDLHAALSARMGEDVLSNVVSDYLITDEKEDLLSFEELAETLEARYREEYGEEDSPAARRSVGYDKEAGEDELPYREKITDGVTGCLELSFLNRNSLEEMSSVFRLIAFAYLYIPRPMYGEEKAFDTISYYFANASELIPEPILLRDDLEYGGAGIGAADCGDGFILDFVVPGERKFFKNLRCLAPLLMAYDAKLVVVNAEGVMVYDCGFEFAPRDGE